MRRRAEVDAPQTPQRHGAGDNSGALAGATPTAGWATPSCHTPAAARSSPLLLDGARLSQSLVPAGEPPDLAGPAGSLPDDEERKIRVGTYLEGGPCGTYAVAARDGLRVYPTLFESALPTALRGRRDGDGDDAAGDDALGGTGSAPRDVEALVRSHRARADTADGAPGPAAASDEDGEIRGRVASFDGGEGRRRGGPSPDDGPPACPALDRDVDVDASARTLPAPRAPSRRASPLQERPFSRGLSQGTTAAAAAAADAAAPDEFALPLLKLNHGDRVQVVSMDARGWVKLARGYGYVRLEDDKQLVKGAWTARQGDGPGTSPALCASGNQGALLIACATMFHVDDEWTWGR